MNLRRKKVRLGDLLIEQKLISEAQLAQAPETFVLHARNPERHLHVGGRVVNFGPVNGAPNVSDAARGRRFGDIAAFRDILKLTHRLGVLHWQGGIVVEPVDVPVPVRHLAAYSAMCDMQFNGRGGEAEVAGCGREGFQAVERRESVHRGEFLL